MNTYIDQNDIMALFFLSYFKYTKVAFKKVKSDEDKGQINGYRTLMRTLGDYSTHTKPQSAELLSTLKGYVVASENSYISGFVSVMEEMIRFIYDRVLVDEKEQSLLERYI